MFLPQDLLSDVFQALDRNEVEKSQLVCFQWYSTVQNFDYFLPLRKFHRLDIGKFGQDHFRAFITIEPHTSPVEVTTDHIAKTLKNSIFSQNSPILLSESSLKLVQNLVELAGTKLKFVEFYAWPPFDLSKLALEKYVLAEKVYIRLAKCFTGGEMDHIFKSSEALNIKPMPKKIDIIIAPDFIAEDSMFDFIKNNKLEHPDRYSLVLSSTNQLDNFCSKIYEVNSV